jgi:hypothetical protein
VVRSNSLVISILDYLRLFGLIKKAKITKLKKKLSNEPVKSNQSYSLQELENLFDNWNLNNNERRKQQLQTVLSEI